MTRAIVRVVTRNEMVHFWPYDSVEEAQSAIERLHRNEVVIESSVFVEIPDVASAG